MAKKEKEYTAAKTAAKKDTVKNTKKNKAPKAAEKAEKKMPKAAAKEPAKEAAKKMPKAAAKEAAKKGAKAAGKEPAKKNGKAAPKEAARKTAKAAAGEMEKKAPKAVKESAKKALRAETEKPVKETAKKPQKETAKKAARAAGNKKAKTAGAGHSPAPSVRIIPLGGLDRIGMNITAIETEESIVVVDCGVAFPDETMLGIGKIVPDVTYLTEHLDKVKAFVITHGHEDHIGAIPNVIAQVNVPIYATKLTIGLIEHKLEEAGLLEITTRKVVQQGSTVDLGDIQVEFIRTNHSIAGASSLAITTPAGVIFHTGDFKIDYTPLFGDPTDLQRIAILGNQGVLAVISDSTNAIRPGFTPSETRVADAFDHLFAEHTGSRILVATFASNVDRVQQLILTAKKFGRKVILQGRSMEGVMEIAANLGYMKIPEDTLISVDEMNNYPDDKLVFITTGSQGEAMAALSRMANSTHKKISIKPGDAIMFSSSPIPGNEKAVSKVMNELSMKGAHVIYQDTHVSGHACTQEIQLLYTLLKPKYAVPMHGEYRHLQAAADIVAGIGIPKENIFVLSAGDVLTISEESAAVTGKVPSGQIYMDNTGSGDVGMAVIKDRQNLGERGFVMVAAAVDFGSGLLAGYPQVISRGFVYLKESEELIHGIEEEAAKAVEWAAKQPGYDVSRIKNEIRNRVEDYIWKNVQRDPIVLATVIEV